MTHFSHAGSAPASAQELRKRIQGRGLVTSHQGALPRRRLHPCPFVGDVRADPRAWPVTSSTDAHPRRRRRPCASRCRCGRGSRGDNACRRSMEPRVVKPPGQDLVVERLKSRYGLRPRGVAEVRPGQPRNSHRGRSRAGGTEAQCPPSGRGEAPSPPLPLSNFDR